MGVKKSKLVQPHEQDPVCKSGKPRKEVCVCPPATPSMVVPVTTLSKLGSIVVHTGEMLSKNGTHFDKVAVEGLLSDPEVMAWIKSMGPLLPLKR